MTFAEVAHLLPNGFHDAKILHFSVDARAKSLAMGFTLWVGSMSDLDPEVYRDITVTARGVSVFFVEPPDPTYPFLFDGSGLAVDGDAVDIERSRFVSERAQSLLKKLPSVSNAYRFFLEDWNSYLYVSAEDVSFAWI